MALVLVAVAPALAPAALAALACLALVVAVVLVATDLAVLAAVEGSVALVPVARGWVLAEVPMVLEVAALVDWADWEEGGWTTCLDRPVLETIACMDQA